MEVVLKSGYYRSLLAYSNVGWFLDEIINLEKKMAFDFKSTNKNIIMTEENEQDFKKNNKCRSCEKNIDSDKVRDPCRLTGKYRGPALNTCIINVTQHQSNIIPFIFHNFGNYDCHMFFKKLIDKKNDKVKFDVIPTTNEGYLSVTRGCIRFFDSSRFLSSSLDSLVKTLVDNSHKTMKNLQEEFVDKNEILYFVKEIEEEDRTIKGLRKDYLDKNKELEEALLNYIGENDLKLLKTENPVLWKKLTGKLAYTYEYFNSVDDYNKPVDKLQKEDFFSKLTNDYPSHREIERTKVIIKKFDIKNGEELTQLFLKSDVLLLACVFEKFRKVSFTEFGINSLYCVSLPGFIWQCGLKYTGTNLQTLQDRDLILLLENNIRGDISSIMGDRYVKSDEKKDFEQRC